MPFLIYTSLVSQSGDMGNPDMKSFGKTIDLLIAFLAIMLVTAAARAITSSLWLMVSAFDPNDVFLRVTIHLCFS